MTACAVLPATAIVHAADGVRLVVTAPCADALFARLSAYVRSRCDDVLWDDAASEVRALLDGGRPRDAVARYFERTGERWDEERLDVLTLEDGEYRVTDGERMADARR